ncbi:Hpt domain-containing protein [Pleomorphovibrio marinus]|uniref:Hpt domain-containing protein n=1 Tax=Pleomorphovibrio marinus TaxID=2164132 RepID=UPI000E0B7011|nr:Hpt domain-containing protein [Pleomorphovibrio marinus]
MYSLINPEVIFHFFDEDPQMVNEMVGIIISTNIQELRGLGGVFESGNFFQVKKKCHKSKPSMSYLGAIKVRGTLEKIEENVEASFERYYPHLLQELDLLEKELGLFLDHINSTGEVNTQIN